MIFKIFQRIELIMDFYFSSFSFTMHSIHRWIALFNLLAGKKRKRLKFCSDFQVKIFEARKSHKNNSIVFTFTKLYFCKFYYKIRSKVFFCVHRTLDIKYQGRCSIIRIKYSKSESEIFTIKIIVIIYSISYILLLIRES